MTVFSDSHVQQDVPSIWNILKGKRFGGLFWTQFLTSFNDNFFKNAIIALLNFGAVSRLMSEEERKLWVILAGLCFIVPYFLFSATAGKWAETYNRIRLVRMIKYCEIAILSLGGIGLIFENTFTMLLMLFAMGVHSTVFSPIKFGILPIYLRKNEMIGGNALIETVTFLAIIMGTIAGTQVVLLPDYGHYIAFLAMVSIAIIGLKTSYKMPYVKSALPAQKIDCHLWKHTKEVCHIMLDAPKIFRYILAGSWFWFVAAVIIMILPIYITDALHMNKDVYTLMLVLFSLGVGAGSVLCASILHGDISARYTPIAALIMGVFMIDIAFATMPMASVAGAGGLSDFMAHPQAWRLIFDFLMISGAGGVYIVPFFTLVQFETAKEQKSRMIAGNNIVNAFMMLAGGIFMLISTQLGMALKNVFLVTGVFCFIGTIIVSMSVEDSVFKSLFKKKSQ